MSEPLNHEDCRQVLIDEMAKRHTEVTVTTAPPVIVNPYTTDPFVCPHGTAFWMEPTSEQIAEWAREGVR
ncbi:hypothetical protein [Amycolatopsis sp. NPDC001319]|uniref:hypothetical protein n=1 Tax=unclassified Amycolatopsis TaxID=2618356 RepID=UPI0036ADDF1F